MSQDDPLAKVLRNVDVEDVRTAVGRLIQLGSGDFGGSSSIVDYVRSVLPELDQDLFRRVAVEVAGEATEKLTSFLLLKSMSLITVEGEAGDFLRLVTAATINDTAGVFNDWIESGFSTDLGGALESVLDGSAFVTRVQSFLTADLGRNLALDIINVDGIQDQIGIFLGTMIASYYLPPGIAEFAGAVIGEFVFDKVLDDILGIEISFGFSNDRTIEFSYQSYNPVTNQFYVDNFWEKKGNSEIKNAVVAARDQYLEAINALVKKVGGTVDVARFGAAADLGFSHYDAPNFALDLFDDETGAKSTIKTRDMNAIIARALVHDFEKLKFLDGDLVAERALQDWKGGQGSDALRLSELRAQLQIADDYRKYLQHSGEINDIISESPTSAFAAGWAATLLAARSAGLTKAYNVVGDDIGRHYLTGGGRDVVDAGGGDDVVSLFAGNDVTKGGSGRDNIDGGAGNDQLDGGDDDDVLVGADGNDVLKGGAGDDRIYGGVGNDTLYGDAGTDRLDGGGGNDTYLLEADKDTVRDTAGIDEVRSTISRDLRYYPGIENLTLTGASNVTGTGNNANNVITGNVGNNVLSGGIGNDTLRGERGNDEIVGGQGNDALDGGIGADVLLGGSGRDKLTGGGGSDRFVFVSLSDSAGNAKDTILDFSRVDRIDLSGIDANSRAFGNQAFQYIGSDDFSGKAGELRYEKKASGTYILADVNGDKLADFVIHLDGAITLCEYEFIS